MKKILFISTLFMMSCQDDATTEPIDVYGCTDETACNFNPDANVNDDSCIGLDCGGTCDENIELWGVCYNIEQTTELNLSNNQLTGQIPNEIGNLINLNYLDLSSNDLSGEIPSEIVNLINLNHLDLQNNALSGEIPSEIGNLTNLNYLRLKNNDITGVIPEAVCNIAELFLYENRFCPPYPDCWNDDSSQDTSECP